MVVWASRPFPIFRSPLGTGQASTSGMCPPQTTGLHPVHRLLLWSQVCDLPLNSLFSLSRSLCKAVVVSIIFWWATRRAASYDWGGDCPLASMGKSPIPSGGVLLHNLSWREERISWIAILHCAALQEGNPGALFSRYTLWYMSLTSAREV